MGEPQDGTGPVTALALELGIEPPVLLALAARCVSDHPRWADEEAAAALAVAYPGHDRDKLADLLLAAVRGARGKPPP